MFTSLSVWLQAVLGRLRDERGWSISTEQLLWIIAIIAMVAIVVAVLNAYISGQLAKIN